MNARVLARLIYRPDGCLVWTGALDAGGYGRWNTGRARGNKTFLVHRYVYEELVGPIPEGLTLDQKCRVRACANPAHLEPVTRAENLRRTAAAGRSTNGHPVWRPQDEMFVLDRPDLTAREVGAVLGRSASAVDRLRKKLKRIDPDVTYHGYGKKQNKAAPAIGGRTVVAKTCNGCGLLLDGSWFHRNSDAGRPCWHGKCRRCLGSRNNAARKLRGRSTAEKAHSRTMAVLTEPTATRARYPYTEADLAVLADTSLSLLEMALATKRTYNGVARARHRYGMDPKVKPSDPSQSQWFIHLAPEVMAEMVGAA